MRKALFYGGADIRRGEAPVLFLSGTERKILMSFQGRIGLECASRNVVEVLGTAEARKQRKAYDDYWENSRWPFLGAVSLCP
jgi:hypothetical protein